MERKWLLIALGNLLVATAIGALLRFAFVEEVSWLHFKSFLHAHSHVAMLGWIYLALAVLMVPAFTSKQEAKRERYDLLYWATQVAVVGMLFSFPWQGYGPVSISFSVVHILCSYLFAWWLWRAVPYRGVLSVLFLRLALGFMLLSTVAIWMMGPIMATSWRHSAFYYMAVQFYLHFQFNGWFLFGVLALLFRYWEQEGLSLQDFSRRWFVGLLVSSCVLTYALAVAWANPQWPVFLVNSIGVLLQLAALVVFARWFWPRRQYLLSGLSRSSRFLLVIGLVSFAAKILMQSAVAVPVVAQAAYTIRNYVIGFIHLILLGAVTAALLSYALHWRYLRLTNRWSRLGLWFIFAGFIGSEGLLFLQGSMLWATLGFLPKYYECLFGLSALVPIGLATFLIGQLRESALGLGRKS